MQYYLITKYEDTILVGKFGDEYNEYKSNVPAWIPKKLNLTNLTWLNGYLNLTDLEHPESYFEGIRNEKFSFIVIAIMFAVLIFVS